MPEISATLEEAHIAAKQAFEELFRPHLARILEEKLAEQWNSRPYILTVGKNVLL